MTTQLSFSVNEQLDAETNKPVQYGTFSRDWAEEQELDELIDRGVRRKSWTGLCRKSEARSVFERTE